MRVGVVAVLAAAGLSMGCGGGDSKSETEESATPQEALTEIGAVRHGLDDALATYKGGDRAKADEMVGDAYLEHFEHVEGPLGKVDHELNEQLEDSIREELRDKIKAKAPAAEVEALKREIEANLDKAEVALR